MSTDMSGDFQNDIWNSIEADFTSFWWSISRMTGRCFLQCTMAKTALSMADEFLC